MPRKRGVKTRWIFTARRIFSPLPGKGGALMARIVETFAGLIGGTPLFHLAELEKRHTLAARLLGKLEFLNPSGSVKDRTALFMLEDAERRGVLKPGGTIIEPTSGNTGIGLAAAAAARGYRVILTMPDSMSAERRKLLSGYGAELVLTDGARGMAGAIEKANALCREIPGSFVPGQFDNPANTDAHYRTTGPEIWADTDGEVDCFVAGVGTGGTVTGTGRYLKEKNPRVRVLAVEPDESPVLSGGQPGPNPIQGLGAGFVPKVMDLSVCDEIIRVRGEDAFAAARELARTEGILAGISAGAALFAALKAAARPDYAGKTVVVLLPDSGERYISTALFDE